MDAAFAKTLALPPRTAAITSSSFSSAQMFPQRTLALTFLGDVLTNARGLIVASPPPTI